MTQYRVVLKFVTSGDALVEVRTEWVPHRDMTQEIVDAFEPYENQTGTFVGYRVESKQDIITP